MVGKGNARLLAVLGIGSSPLVLPSRPPPPSANKQQWLQLPSLILSYSFFSLCGSVACGWLGMEPIKKRKKSEDFNIPLLYVEVALSVTRCLRFSVPVQCPQRPKPVENSPRSESCPTYIAQADVTMMEAGRMSRPGGSSGACASAVASVNASC